MVEIKLPNTQNDERFIEEGLIAIFKLHTKIDSEYQIPNHDDIRKSRKRDSITLVIYEEGSCCGFIRGHYDDSSKRAFVKDVYVSPERRLSGHSKKLIEAFEAEARKLGAQSIALRVDLRNTIAVSAWEACAFKPYQVQMKKEL
jgi:GNAT superfamily N-acetyltransferase